MNEAEPEDPKRDRRDIQAQALDSALRIAQPGATPEQVLAHAVIFARFLEAGDA